MRKHTVLLLVALAVAAPVALAASRPVTLSGFTTWTSTGSRLAFIASSAGGRRGYLWTQAVGAARPTLLRASPPVAEEQIDALAPGPKGSWAALEQTRGYDRLDVVSSRGGGAAVSVATGSASIAQVFGDGTHLGYLWVTPTGLVQLFAISGARGRHVADLPGVHAPQQVAVAGGNLAIRERDGTVAVYTLAGAPLATIKANAASIALTAQRVVVRTRTKRLVVYGLHGGLVHDWRLAATSWTAGLATDGRYAVYLGANKAVHAVRLANGRDRIVARAGAAFFFHGVGLAPSDVVVPVSSVRTTSLRLVPIAALRSALG